MEEQQKNRLSIEQNDANMMDCASTNLKIVYRDLPSSAFLSLLFSHRHRSHNSRENKCCTFRLKGTTNSKFAYRFARQWTAGKLYFCGYKSALPTVAQRSS